MPDKRRLPREVLAEIPPSAWRTPRAPVVEPEPDPEKVEMACDWSDFRKDCGVCADAGVRRAEHRAFEAGWIAGRHGDQSGPQR